MRQIQGVLLNLETTSRREEPAMHRRVLLRKCGAGGGNCASGVGWCAALVYSVSRAEAHGAGVISLRGERMEIVGKRTADGFTELRLTPQKPDEVVILGNLADVLEHGGEIAMKDAHGEPIAVWTVQQRGPSYGVN